MILSCISVISYLFISKFRMGSRSLTGSEIGQKIDSINGVYVYYNGSIGNVSGRNLAPDGYNLGLKYQCVEFIKRDYNEHLNHKMPNSYGHAKDFFNPSIEDGQINPGRNLIQFKNSGKEKPQVNDILVFKATVLNPFGHVAIVSAVEEDKISIVQQNAGILFSSSRESIKIFSEQDKWIIQDKDILGWLRKI